MNKNYDLEAVYDNEIGPLMSQVLEICQRNNMPMLATFAYKSDEEGQQLCTSAIFTEKSDGRTPGCMREALDVIKTKPLLASFIVTKDGELNHELGSQDY